MSIAVTPDDLRLYSGFPEDVPDDQLARHIESAVRDLAGRVGVAAPSFGMVEDWREAITVRALASALPWLNTFSLEGAAKVGRLEGGVEFRFLNPDEVEARVAALNARFEELAGRISRVAPGTDEGASSASSISFLDAV